MAKLKPVDAYVQLIYNCPTCHNEIWANITEAQAPGFKVVCCCGKSYSLVRVKDILVRYTSNENQEVNVVDVNQPKRDIAIEAAARLRAVGYDDAEVRVMMMKAAPSSSASDLVREALATVN